MSLAFLISVFTASLLGSTHCAGMCGPFVLLMSGPNVKSMPAKLLAYHLGRWITYATLGLIAALVGTSLNQLGTTIGWQSTAAWLAAAALLITAVVLILRQIGVRIQHLPIPRAWQVVIQSAFQVSRHWPGWLRAGWIGLVSTWIPCGWLYAFVLVAAGVGDLWRAELIMAAFWLGSLPLLSVFAWASSRLSLKYRAFAPWLSIACCLILAVSIFSSRTMLNIAPLTDQMMAQPNDAARLDAAKDTKLPCCESKDD